MIRRIGRYEIQDELGRGAFGRVYRAYDPSVKRAIAIKVLTSEPAPEILDRFRHEAGTTGSLTHNNIVTVYEYGEHEGIPYIVMELLEGETLQKSIVSKRPLTLLEKVHIMHQVAEGLAAARAKGVIHRDIKPANIMLLPNGAAKIMDFGISRVLDKDYARYTRQGDLVGTLMYMSPELFQGFDADEITDIFAYGVVYYELLTGIHPFAGKDAAVLMFRIATVEPVLVRKLTPDCPESLESMVLRMIAKDRENRTRSFDEVLLDSRPIHHELRCLRSAALMRGVENLVDGGQIDGAQARIRQALELDASNQEARRWRKTLQERLERQLREVRTAALLLEGDGEMEGRHFQEALQSYEAVLHLDKSHAGAEEGRQRAKACILASRKAGRLLSEARSDLQLQNLDSALVKVTQAMEVDPGIPDGAALLEIARRRLDDRRLDAALERADAERAKGDFEAALATLARIGQEPRAADRVALVLARIASGQAEAERERRRARFQSQYKLACDAVEADFLDAAEAGAAALVSEFPEESGAAELLSKVQGRLAVRRRAVAIAALKRSAASLLERKRFPDAVAALAMGLRDYPEEESLRPLYSDAAARKAAHDRALALDAVLERLENLHASGELDEALQTASQATAELGPDERVAERRRNLERQREAREYAAQRARILAQGHRFLEEDNPEKAVTILEEALPLYPDDADMVPLLAEARQAEEAKQDRLEIGRLLRGAVAAERRGHLDQALREIQAALARFPAAADLISAASRLETRIAAEIRRKRAAHRYAIEAAIGECNWDGASARLEQARREFPEHEDWREPGEQVQAGLLQVRHEMERKRAYETALSQALEARQARNYETAESLLEGLLAAGALDERAQEALEELSAERYWTQWLDQMAAGCREARRLSARGDAAGPALLENLKKSFHPHGEELFRQAQEREAEVYQSALDSAERAKRANDFLKAEEILKNLLEETGELDRRARELLETVEKQHWYEITLAAAQTARTAGDYTAAEQILKDAIGRGSLDGRAALALTAVAEERYCKIREESIQVCLSRAGQHRENEDFPAALSIVEAMLSQYPGNNELLRDRAATVQAIALARGRENQAALDSAEQARAAGDYPGAMRILRDLMENDDRARLALAKIAQEMERKEQARALAAGRAEAEQLAESGNLDGAIASLEQLIRKHPGNREPRQDLDVARNRKEAARLCAKGNLEAALLILEKLLERYPDNTGMQRDRNHTAKEIEAARVRSYEAMLVEATQSREAGKPQAALQILHKLAKSTALDSRAKNLRDTLVLEQQIGEGRRESGRLIQKGDLQPAIVLLRALAIKHPDNGDLQQDLDAAETLGLERRETRMAYERGLQEAEQARAGGRYRAAADLLTKLLPNAADDRSRQMLKIVREEWTRQSQNEANASPGRGGRSLAEQARRLERTSGSTGEGHLLLKQLRNKWPMVAGAAAFLAILKSSFVRSSRGWLRSWRK